MKKIKKIGKIILWVLGIALALAVAIFIYFNLPVSGENDNAQLGVTFSARYASDIGLDWKQAFIATLDDLHVKKIRIPVYWDLVEPTEGQYDWTDLDWELQQAKVRNAEIVLVVGQKVPRWPECAIPAWAATSDAKRKASLVSFVDTVVKRYKNDSEIKYWQIENEPFLAFGICPAIDSNLLDSEIAVARMQDSTRPIVITDSGELSLWVRAASRADVFGTTMYRTIFKQGWGYYQYPIGPRFFQFKYFLNKILAHQNNAVVIELQAEPWISGYTTNEPLEEQFKSMNPDQLKANVTYARKVGFPDIYLWGVEWWYWLKVEKNHPELWATAKELFSHNSQ
jgi:hypothetical protein